VDSSERAWRELTAELVHSHSPSDAVHNPFSDETLERELDELASKDIDVVTCLESRYPQALKRLLGDRSPPFLYFRGNESLFRGESIGFCGSRHASELAIGVCQDIVQQLSERQFIVTAGYAAGVDQAAHKAALQANGKTIAVLAEGILNFSVRTVLASVWDWERALVVSEFLPHARWAVGKAMQRNRTIIGLSRALVVIEARSTGGTFEAGKDALLLNHPLFAPIYGDEKIAEGNRILLARGALPIKRNRETGRARLEPVMAALDQALVAEPRKTLFE
jgi:DNA processing protein